MGTLRNITDAFTMHLLEDIEERVTDFKVYAPTEKHPEKFNISYRIGSKIGCVNCKNIGETIDLLKKFKYIDDAFKVDGEWRFYIKEFIDDVPWLREVFLDEILTDNVVRHICAVNELPVKTITSKIIHAAFRYIAMAI